MDIITGMTGKPHVTSEDHRNIIASIVGDETYIPLMMNQLTPEIVDNCKLKINSGILVHHGCVSIVPNGTYDEVSFEPGTFGTIRYDYVVARYEKDAATGCEKVEWKVIQGVPDAENPTYPEYEEGNMQEGDLVDECPVFAIRMDGTKAYVYKYGMPSLYNLDYLITLRTKDKQELKEKLKEINEEINEKIDESASYLADGMISANVTNVIYYLRKVMATQGIEEEENRPMLDMTEAFKTT